MTKKEIRMTEREHMKPGDVRFFYKGRFIVCVKCGSRFRMRYNGTLHYVQPRGDAAELKAI